MVSRAAAEIGHDNHRLSGYKGLLPGNFTMRAEINARPNGARFFRADLHIHSCVGSHDVADKACTPENIVATAKHEGLDIIAIADHNEITAVDAAYPRRPPADYAETSKVDYAQA